MPTIHSQFAFLFPIQLKIGYSIHITIVSDNHSEQIRGYSVVMATYFYNCLAFKYASLSSFIESLHYNIQQVSMNGTEGLDKAYSSKLSMCNSQQFLLNFNPQIDSIKTGSDMLDEIGFFFTVSTI